MSAVLSKGLRCQCVDTIFHPTWFPDTLLPVAVSPQTIHERADKEHLSSTPEHPFSIQPIRLNAQKLQTTPLTRSVVIAIPVGAQSPCPAAKTSTSLPDDALNRSTSLLLCELTSSCATTPLCQSQAHQQQLVSPHASASISVSISVIERRLRQKRSHFTWSSGAAASPTGLLRCPLPRVPFFLPVFASRITTSSLRAETPRCISKV
eukprot:652376-Rhodomonas_salina.4